MSLRRFVENNVFDMDRVYYDVRYEVYRTKNTKTDDVWDSFWEESSKNYFGKIASFYRKTFISRFVKIFCDKHFPSTGVLLEAGCGKAETSFRIPKRNRIFIACDISLIPLTMIKNKNIDIKLQADIFNLPIRNESLDGIYNVGVMEHFTFEENVQILKEFKRVLKRNGKIILFWPWKYCWVEIVSKIKPLFPESPSMFGSFDFNKLLSKAGLRLVEEKLSIIDGFIHKAVVLSKR